MDAPENFKFDVRIRSRMLAKGGLAEGDVHKHLEALKDLSASVESIDVGQPAIGTPAERLPPPPPRPRVEPSLAPPPPPAAERSQPRSIAPGPLAVDEGWDDEDDEDESDDIDDEEDGEAKDAKPVEEKLPDLAAAPKPVEEKLPDLAAAEPEAEPVSGADDDEDDVDEEDSASPGDGEEE